MTMLYVAFMHVGLTFKGHLQGERWFEFVYCARAHVVNISNADGPCHLLVMDHISLTASFRIALVVQYLWLAQCGSEAFVYK